MEELLKIVESSSPLPIRRVVTFIFNKNVELMNLPQEKIDEKISLIFTFISQNPTTCLQPDWDKLRFLLIIMVVSLSPMQSSLPQVVINTNSGPLFNILLALHELRKDHSDSIFQYVQAYYKGLESFQNGSGAKSFYSLTHCYYLQSLPQLLKNNLKPEQFSELLNRFFASIPQVKPETININFISFTTDMFRQVPHHIMKHSLLDMIPNFAQSFKEMLEICSSCPNIILLNLLHPWYAFYKFTTDPKQQRSISYNFQEQIEQLTICYEKVATGKHHELHRFFSWHIAIHFYGLTQGREQQTRVLLLICNAFRSIPRLEGMRGVPDATKEIHSLMCNQQSNEGIWALFHILTSCESTISLGISDIKKIRGVCINPDGEENTIRKRTITFSEQIFEDEMNTDIDCELSTEIEEIQFNDFNSAKECFDKQIEYLNTYRTSLITGITFQFFFIDSILNDLQNEDNFISSVAFYYVKKLIRLGIKLMIVSSQRVTMLEQFYFNEILLNQKDPYKPSTNSNVSQKIPSFSIICRRYMEFTTRIPMQYYSLLAKEIASMIYKALAKGQISFLFTKYFSFLENAQISANDGNGCNQKNSIQDTLFSHVLCQLMEIVSLNLENFLAQSSAKTKLIFNLILFIIRIGKPKDSSYCHQCLKLFLKTYYKLIFTSTISNIKKTSNQVYSLKLLKIYLNVINDGYNNINNFKLRSVQRIYDEFQPFAKKASLSPLLLITVPENDAVNVPSLLSLLIASLQSEDVDIIKSASDFCLELFNTEIPINSNNTMILQIFHNWFKSFFNFSNEEAMKIVECLPEYASCFNHPLIPPLKIESNLIHDETGFDLMEILNEVAFNMGSKDVEIANLFSLVINCFEVMKVKINQKEENLKEPMRRLLLFLSYCSNFDCVREKVMSYLFDLINHFVDLFAKGESSLFLFILISISGNSKSESSKFATYLCITFLEEAKKRGVGIEIFRQFIDEMMRYFSPQAKLLSMLCGFSLFIRLIPGSISLHTMRCFLISSCEFYIFDTDFTLILNKMLKHFIQSLTREEQAEFVYMSYDVLSHTLLNCSLILLKRLNKLQISLPIHDFNEILENVDVDSSSSTEQLIVFQKFSAALMCGIEGPIVLNEKIKMLIHNFITSKNDSGNMADLFRKMSLYISIIKSPETFKVLSSDDLFVKNVLTFFVNTLSKRAPLLKKNAAKAFRILAGYNDNFSSTKQIEIYCNNPSLIFEFFTPVQERIAFYRRLIKIVPQKIPYSITQEFLDSIFEYVEFNDIKKFAFLANLVHFVKFLTIKDFIQLEPVQLIILSPYKDETREMTYLEVYIEKILILYQHREIPFHSIIHKYVMKFLKMFPKETVLFILQLPSKCDMKIAFDFLEDLIENDDSLLFFNTFVQYIESSKDIILNCNHPNIFQILYKLSQVPYFAELLTFQLLLDNLLFSFIHTAIHTEASKRDIRLYTTITEIAYSALNTFKTKPSIERLFKFTQIFKLPSMINTHLYLHYITIIFKKSDQSFISEIVKFIMEKKPTITPKVFEILLGHSLKYLKELDKEILLTLWGFLSNKLDKNKVELNQTNLVVPILICVIRLLRKYDPTEDALKKILIALQITISSPDTEIVLYSLKLSCELVKKKLMPPPLYFQIVEQIFSYTKYFDLPYSKYTYSFLKMNNEFEFFPAEVENSVIESISFFPHDKFSSIREMKRFIDIFTEVPQFLICIPFSLIVALALYLEANLKQRKPKDDVVDIEPLFIAGLKFCSIVKPSQSEIDRFIESCFKFFGFIVSQQALTKEFTDAFFEYILKNGCTKFPIELLNDVCSNPQINNSYLFAFICCAMKFVPEEIEKEEYIEIVRNSFQFAQDPHSAVSNSYLVALIDFAISKSELNQKYYPIICTIVDSWTKSSIIDETIRDRFIIFCNGMICGCREDFKMTQLMNIWQFVESLPNIPQNTISLKALYRFVMTSIENIPIKQQLTYIEFMIRKAINSSQLSFFFISVLPIIFNSENVSNKVKNSLLESIPNLFAITSIDSFEEVIDSVVNFGEEMKINVDIYIVSILLSQCKYCSQSNRLIYFRRIMKLIQDITFEQFISEIPLIFWSDEYLSITTALITPDEWPIWFSVFAFSHYLKNISDQMAAASFCKHINEKNSSQVVTFLSRILTEKPHFIYSKVCSALLQCFYMKGININMNIVEKAIKYHDQQFYLPEFLNETIPSSFYLMPNILNDSIFGHFLNDLPNNEAAAIALTFLNEYQAAESIYSSSYPPNHPLFESVLKVNSQFASIFGEQNIDSFLKPLCAINQENDSILIKLSEAIKYFMWKEEEQSLGLLFEAEMMSVKYLQKRRNLSLFEKEKIAIVESTIRIIKRHIQSLKTSNPSPELVKAVSPIFILSLTSIDKMLDEAPQTQMPVIINDENGSVLLDPTLSSDFPCVSMITNRNLLVVSKPQIDSYLITMSLQISENQVTSKDWCKFAHFCFNVFLSQPSLDLFQVTYGVYSQIIGLSHSNDEEIWPFIKVEAPARIITLIRIAIESSNASMAMIVTSNSGAFKREFYDIWMPWLVQIIDLARSNWFCSVVSELTKEAMYRSSIYCEKLGCQRIAEILNPNADSLQPLAKMKGLEREFDQLFLLEFNKIYEELVKNNKEEATKFRKSGHNPSNLFEFAALQVDNDDDQSESEMIKEEESFSATELDKMKQVVLSLNKLLPLTLPNTSIVYKIYDDIRMISPDLIIFYATTSNSNQETYLIQKSTKSIGFSTTIITFSNILYTFKKLFDSNYQSRIRSLNLNIPKFFEIGHRYIIIPFGDLNINLFLSNIFSQKVGMTHKKWLSIKMRHAKEEDEWPFSSPQFSLVSPSLSFEEISLPETALLEFYSSTTKVKDFITFRRLLNVTLASNASVRYIFNAPYPSIERVVFNKSGISSPFLISDFEGRCFNESSHQIQSHDSIAEIVANESSFRLSPNILGLLGSRCQGEFLLSFAAAMTALTSRIEVVRACFEILVADPQVGEDGENISPLVLLTNRNRLEEKLIDATPPTGPNVSDEDCVDWFDRLMELIKKSENTEIQNPNAIPWF